MNKKNEIFFFFTLNTQKLKVKKNRQALIFNNRRKNDCSFRSAYLGLSREGKEALAILKKNYIKKQNTIFFCNNTIASLFTYIKKLIKAMNIYKINNKGNYLVVCLLKKGLGVLKYLSIKSNFYYINYFLPQVLSNRKALIQDSQFVNGSNFYFLSKVFNKCMFCYYLYSSSFDLMLINLIKKKSILVLALTDNDNIISKVDYFYICNVYSVAAMYAAIILLVAC